MADTGIKYIDVEEFTKNAKIEESNPYFPVLGEGIFDKLMETATKHLTAQYKANRIRKEDYADLYAHIYEVTLQAALTAWLQKPEQAAKVELLNAQTEHEYVKIDQTKEQTKLIIEQQALTHEQTLHEVSKRLNTEQQTLLLIEQTAHETSKRLNTEAQTQLINAQKLHTDAQTLLVGAQKLNVEADTLLKGSQKLLIDSQKALTDSQKIHEDAKKLLTDAQKILTTNQAIHEPSKKANTEADTLTKFQQIKVIKAQAEYIKAQAKAADKDEQVKEAQAKSEEMKANLYKRQIEGFDEDFKQKLLKVGLDSWAVAFSVAQDVIASDVNMIPKAMKTKTLDSLWDGAIAPDVDMNKYDSRDVTTTSSPELLAQEPDYKSYQDNY